MTRWMLQFSAQIFRTLATISHFTADNEFIAVASCFGSLTLILVSMHYKLFRTTTQFFVTGYSCPIYCWIVDAKRMLNNAMSASASVHVRVAFAASNELLASVAIQCTELVLAIPSDVSEI
jgi:hypothetical protein